jgi:hypothetical protein
MANCATDGLTLGSDEAAFNYVSGNIIYGCLDRAVLFRTAGTTWKGYVYNNTISACGIGLGVSDLVAATGLEFKNNIVEDCLRSIFYSDINTSTIVDTDYNCFYGNTPAGEFRTKTSPVTLYDFDGWQGLGYDPNSVWGDPKFTDSDNQDYHLEKASPCRNIGADLGVTNDFDGRARKTIPDIGAFEYSTWAKNNWNKISSGFQYRN